MAVCPALKIDSNLTGLSYAEEECLKQLPATPYWRPLEPNSYSDFGVQVTTLAREPINSSRQVEKGIVSNITASAGFNQDFTSNNTFDLLQGFFFANKRAVFSTEYSESKTTQSTVTSVSETGYNGTGLTGLVQGSIILASGFGVQANNGIKQVTGESTDISIEIGAAGNLQPEAIAPSSASIKEVGYRFPNDSVSLELSGNLVRFVYPSNPYFEEILSSFVTGQWIYLGGDATATRFNSYGFARIGAIGSGYIEFDKVSWSPVAEDGTGKSIAIYFGDVLKNEYDPDLIVRKSYNFERTLGKDGNGRVMSEYVTGAVANEITLNLAQNDKVTVDFTYVACDGENRTGVMGVKPGSRPILTPSEAFNTSSDVARTRLSVIDPSTSNPKPLFAFATSFSISINNNVTPNNAVGVMGAFETTAGNFTVTGQMEVYFAGVEAAQAVRNNSNVTFDVAIVKANYGVVFDIPLLSLGDGRNNVTANQPIMINLETNAARSKFNHTLLAQQFSYLPNIASERV